MSRLGLILIYTRCMYGVLIFTFYHRYGSFLMNSRWSMHIWILNAPHQMIITFSMFQDGRELENFPTEKNKYNKMEDIIKLM